VVIKAIKEDKNKDKFALRLGKYLNNAKNVYVKVVFNDILVI